MIRLLKNVLCVVSVLCFVEEVLCIKCWSCDSNRDPKCGVPFDNSTIKLADCTTEPGEDNRIPNVCFIQRLKVNDDWSYFRGCGFARHPTVDMPCVTQSRTSKKGEKIYVEHCSCFDSDGCNSQGNIYDKKD